MTEFLGVRNMSRWVAKEGVTQTLAGLTDYIEADFRRWKEFDKVSRLASHSDIGVIELMPTADDELYTFKYVNGHPANPARGYQTVTAFGVVSHVHNGYPVFVSEMTLLTALRTAAVSAFGARTLARPDSQVMAMIGTGSQAEFQALAMKTVMGITKLQIYDIDPDAMAKFARNMRPHGFDITVAGSGSEAVAGADIVTTCTADKTHATVLHEADVRPGMHLNAIGGDCPGKTELENSILDIAKVFVEYEPQSRIEGEIQFREDDFKVTEMWEVLDGIAPGRTSDEDITLFDSVGFATEDFSALRYVLDRVTGTEFVESIDLIAEPEDPKDLFGLIGSLSPVS